MSVSDRSLPMAAAATTEREDSSMSEELRECSVCHRPRAQGSETVDRDLFVCIECEEAADQLLTIQDALWGRPEADDTES